VLVHKAPWVFQGIWKIIKGWLDPVVASKVHFTNGVEELNEFIEKDHIPEELGGDEKWSWRYIEPNPGENQIMKEVERKNGLESKRSEIVKAYEQATIQWIEGSTPVANPELMQKRNLLAQSLKDDYWVLDPYVRARSVYDRIGMIQPGGKIDFYLLAQQAAVPTTNGNTVETSADDLD